MHWSWEVSFMLLPWWFFFSGKYPSVAYPVGWECVWRLRLLVSDPSDQPYPWVWTLRKVFQKIFALKGGMSAVWQRTVEYKRLTPLSDIGECNPEVSIPSLLGSFSLPNNTSFPGLKSDPGKILVSLERGGVESISIPCIVDLFTFHDGALACINSRSKCIKIDLNKSIMDWI